MTNASVYVYETLEEYMKLYPQGQDTISEEHLSALHINEKSIVLVAGGTNKAAGYRPDFSKSLVYFDGGEKAFEKYEKDFEPIVEVIRSKDNVIFVGQEVEKSLAIARAYNHGDEESIGHVRGYILYDTTRPRINLIMRPVKH